jgi:hypothetical protein
VVAMHMSIEAMLGISLYSYLYFKQVKILRLSYYYFHFLFNKTGEQESGTVSARKWEQRDMVQTMYTHVSKCKNNKIKNI